MPDLGDVIAQAIKEADSSIFNEDYSKQARAVLVALRRNGYEVLPREPKPEALEFILQNLPFGRLKQSDLIRAIYRLVVENARRFG